MKTIGILCLVLAVFLSLACTSNDSETNKPTKPETPTTPTAPTTPTSTSSAYRCEVKAKEGYALGLKMMRSNKPIKAFVLLNYVANQYPTDDYGIKASELLLTIKTTKTVSVQRTCPACNGARVYTGRCKICGGSGAQTCSAKYEENLFFAGKNSLHCKGGFIYYDSGIIANENNGEKRICRNCDGRGFLKCWNCSGSGTVDGTCQNCNGSGTSMEKVEKEVAASEVYNNADVVFTDLVAEQGIKDYLISHTMPSDEEKMLLVAAEDYVLTIAKRLLEEKNYPLAIAFYFCCGEVSGKDVISKVKEYRQQGISYYLAMGDSCAKAKQFQEAYSWYNKVFVLVKENQAAAQKIKDTKEQEIQHYQSLGDQCLGKKDFTEAYSWYEKALSLDQANEATLQKIKNAKEQQIQYYISIGNSCVEKQKFAEAYLWYNKALVLDRENQVTLQKIKDTKEQEIQYDINLGDACVEKKNFTEAYQWYNKALVLDRENQVALQKFKDTKEKEIQHYLSLGDQCLGKKDFTEAYSWYEKALSLDKANKVTLQKIKDARTKGLTYYASLGDQCTKKKNFAEAYPWYEKALSLDKENKTVLQRIKNTKAQELQYYLSLGDECIGKKNFIEAYPWYEKALSLDKENKTVLQKIKDSKMAEVQWQAEIRQREIQEEARQYGLPLELWKACRYKYQGQIMLDMTTNDWCKLSASQQSQYAGQYQQGYAAAKNLPLEKTISLPNLPSGAKPLVLRLIPPGRFWMGSLDGESDRYDNEGPRHRVVISSAFYLSKYECTQAQWKAVMGNNPSNFQNAGQDAPVERVGWHDVAYGSSSFCGKTGLGLPSEAAWEYACRAGTIGAYYSGESSPDSIAWYEKNSSATHSVGQKSANGFGLYDTLGNVYEWCCDDMRHYSSRDEYDPIVREYSAYFVYRGGGWRGGSWCDYARAVRCAFRYHSISLRYDYLGFRVFSPTRR